MRHHRKRARALTRLFGTAAIGVLPLLAPGLSAATEPTVSVASPVPQALVLAADDQSPILLTAEPVEGDMDDCGCDLALEEVLAGIDDPAPAAGAQAATATRTANARRE